MMGVLRVFRRQFLYAVLYVTAAVFVLSVIANGGTGQLRTPMAALIAALYASGITTFAIGLFFVPVFRRWALEPPAKLGEAGIWVAACIIGGMSVTIAAVLRFVQLIS